LLAPADNDKIGGSVCISGCSQMSSCHPLTN
jgi:hypothetical protein